MPRILIKPKRNAIGAPRFRLALTDARAERMELPLSELNSQHTRVVTLVDTLVNVVRRQLVRRTSQWKA